MKNEKSCGAVIEYNGKILLVQQKKSGNIGFPKGHIQNKESEVETATREVLEETGIAIDIVENIRYSLTYIQNKNINKKVVYFLAHPKENFKLNKQKSEISNILWVEKDKVKDILTYDNLKDIWNKFNKYLNK